MESNLNNLGQGYSPGRPFDTPIKMALAGLEGKN
jgi:hypothetical protein